MVKETAPELSSVFHALADRTRRSILRDTAVTEKTVSEIAKPYKMSLAAVSKHLKVLEAANLITRRRRGSFQFVRLNPTPLRTAGHWLTSYQHFGWRPAEEESAADSSPVA